MNKKGFFLTLDSFLSLLFVTSVVLISFLYVSYISLDAWNSVDLRHKSSDVLTVMEKGNAFEDYFQKDGGEVLASSTLALREDLNGTPDRYCFDLILFKEGDESQAELYAIKAGCSFDAIEYASVERPVVVKKEGAIGMFTARLRGWIK